LRIDSSISSVQSVTYQKRAEGAEKGLENGAMNRSDESEGVKEKKEESKTDDKKAEQTGSEKELIAKLQARDMEVRAHEAAHLAAAGGIAAGGASFSYQRGPDGKMYAIGGEVPISTSGGGSAQEKVELMRQVAAAAMAPADPSPQDYAVAANARSEEMRALQELRKEQEQARKEQGLTSYENVAKSDEKSSGEVS